MMHVSRLLSKKKKTKMTDLERELREAKWVVWGTVAFIVVLILIAHFVVAN